MKRISVLAIVGLSTIAAAQGGWKQPNSVRAIIRVEAKDRPSRSFEILKSGDNIRLLTSVPLDGELDGIQRVEVIGPKGIFTWIEGKPQHVLSLLYPSTIYALDFLARPRFSRADLEFNIQGIEHILKKRVLVARPETIAGRECMVLIVPDRPDSTRTDFQKLWIDRETGLTMRMEDYASGELRYRRDVSKIEFLEQVDLSSFQPSADAVVVRGLVSPAALLFMPTLRTEQDLANDISRIDAKSPIKDWFRTPGVPDGFKYAVTRYREARSYSVQWGSGNEAGRQNQLVQSQEFVVLGPAVELRVDEEGKRSLLIRSESGESHIVIGEDLTTASGSSSANESDESSTSGSTTGKVVQTDWVDAASGDTVSLFQVNGKRVETVLSRLLLPEPRAIAGDVLKEAKLYEVEIPFRCRVLTWTNETVSYALVSTRMSEEQMTSFAQKLISSQ